LDRKDNIKRFIEAVNRLEEKFNIKIVTDNPDQEIMYLDKQEGKLYYLQNGNVAEW
jgi:uncharacterized pyridoxamine 5'-phosphate oxidase family protein